MPWFDLPEDQLRTYRVSTTEPEELDAWWTRQLDRAREAASPTTYARYAADAYGPAEVYDVEISGARGDRIRGWLLRPPAGATGAVPVAVTFIGYGGGRGVPYEHLALPAAGIATF